MVNILTKTKQSNKSLKILLICLIFVITAMVGVIGINNKVSATVDPAVSFLEGDVYTRSCPVLYDDETSEELDYATEICAVEGLYNYSEIREFYSNGFNGVVNFAVGALQPHPYDFNIDLLAKPEFENTKTYTIYAHVQYNGSFIPVASNVLVYYTKNETVPLPPDPVKDGYTFVGWFYNQTFTDPYIIGTPIFADTVLYAKFNINQYTVTYILNGETYKTDTVNWNTTTQNYNVSQTGYTFSGWHTDSGYITDYIFANPVTANLTLYAKYTINTYTVTFDIAGGVVDSGTAVQSITYGSAATAPTVSRIGYTFVGWSVAFNNVTSNLTVTAQWELNTYTVTFDIVGGVVDSGTAVQSITHGSAATAPTVSRIGYTFVGWSVAFDNVISNLTVTAQWEIITFTVTFYVDDEIYHTELVNYGTIFF